MIQSGLEFCYLYTGVYLSACILCQPSRVAQLEPYSANCSVFGLWHLYRLLSSEGFQSITSKMPSGAHFNVRDFAKTGHCKLAVEQLTTCVFLFVFVLFVISMPKCCLAFVLIQLLCFGVAVAWFRSKDEFGWLLLLARAFCMSQDCELAYSTCTGVVTQPAKYYIGTWILIRELLQALHLWVYCRYKTIMKLLCTHFSKSKMCLQGYHKEWVPS